MVLELYYQNVRGLNGKANLILPLASLLCFDLICFTETWLQPDFQSSLVLPADYYTSFRKDRNLDSTVKSNGGGVMIGVKNCISSTQLKRDFERPNLDMLWIRLDLPMPLYLCCVYIPHRSFYSQYNDFLKAL